MYRFGAKEIAVKVHSVLPPIRHIKSLMHRKHILFLMDHFKTYLRDIASIKNNKMYEK